jgi:hypothetical protein
MTKHQRR